MAGGGSAWLGCWGEELRPEGGVAWLGEESLPHFCCKLWALDYLLSQQVTHRG